MILDFVVYPFHMVSQVISQIKVFLANHALKFSLVYMDRCNVLIKLIFSGKCGATMLALVSSDFQMFPADMVSQITTLTC